MRSRETELLVRHGTSRLRRDVLDMANNRPIFAGGGVTAKLRRYVGWRGSRSY